MGAGYSACPQRCYSLYCWLNVAPRRRPRNEASTVPQVPKHVTPRGACEISTPRDAPDRGHDVQAKTKKSPPGLGPNPEHGQSHVLAKKTRRPAMITNYW